ncbi:HDOD domain-containing protein [Marinobacter bryozoorum]|uniref:HDOD domain-containing protein n=1 Tax=Marinobacter bryozoorum TaxID=256324 RepID=UPI0020046BA3|nr:HDOD domain-containing protein [Marinobacter bryozoorum]MCK7544135.1 HDOD domain-containing protein [Marinobacter bryozoorum]
MTSTQAWVSYLSRVELPVLANTLKRINELTDSNSSTVSRAITLIGFDSVKSMAISSLIVDSLLGRSSRPSCSNAWPGLSTPLCRPAACYRSATNRPSKKCLSAHC